MLSVFNGRFKRRCEVLGDKQRKIRVLCLVVLGLIGMAVDDGQSFILVLSRHLSRWIGTKYSHLVVKCGRIVDKFCFVELFI